MPTTLTLNAESSSNWHHRPHISISTSPQSERPLQSASVSRYPVRLDRGHFSSIGGSCHEEEESLVYSVLLTERLYRLPTLLLTGNQLAPVLPSLRHPLLVAHATTMRPSTPSGLVVFIGCLPF